MSVKTLNLTPSLYDYLLKVSLREPEVLEALRKETKTMHGAAMQISPEQGQFMQLLIQLLAAKKTLDIGTFTGYSALSVALALPDDGKVIACDVDQASTNVARAYWTKADVAHKIDLRIAPALITLDNLIADGEADTFDFAFIDADKANYLAYYERALTLIRTGGLIAIDNVLWDGRVAAQEDQDKATQAIRELNDYLLKDERITLSMLPLGDGLTLARKR